MESIIHVDKLVKQYKKAKQPSVNQISFDVKPGEFFAFLGPNGAGKTTTISILTTTLSMTSGTVKIAGYDLEKEAKKVRENIGIIFQNPSLDLDLSAEENIRLHVSTYGLYPYRPLYSLMPKAYKDRIEELAEIVGIRETMFKKLKTFSGGMRRKLEIIRSLMHNPKILFLDEPTQGLDPSSRLSLWQYLQKVRKEENITIFLTTHYLDEAEEADRICILNQGEILMLGTPAEMKNRLLKDKSMRMDASDRPALQGELERIGALYTEEDHYLNVSYQEQTPQAIISQIRTPLTMLDVQQPTLEAAYVDLLKQTGRTEDK